MQETSIYKKILSSFVLLLVLIVLVFSIAMIATVKAAETSNPILDTINKLRGGMVQTSSTNTAPKIKLTAAQEKIQEQRNKIKEKNIELQDALKSKNAESVKEKKAELDLLVNDMKNSTASSTAQLMKEREMLNAEIAKIKVKKDEFNKKIEAAKVEKKKVLKEAAKATVQNGITEIVGRLNDAINQLSKIDTRITIKISNLEATGADVQNLRSLLGVAKTKVTAAREAVSNIQSSTQVATSAGVGTVTRDLIKTSVAAAKTAVKDAQQAYTEVVQLIKPGQTSKTESATTTATSTRTD